MHGKLRPRKHSYLLTHVMRILVSSTQPSNKMKMMMSLSMHRTRLQELTEKTKKTQTTITTIQNKMMARTQKTRTIMTATTTMITEMTCQM